MAKQLPNAFRFGPVRLLRDATLGSGAYGQVCKATLGELPCAAKLLHPTIVDPIRPRNRALFEQECRFLSEIHHPNIVQYLGVERDRATGLPILLMELMDDSLTHFLELSEARLPYHVQVNINYDIAQALAFLHTNRILHRDLSSNNVLLIGAGVRAKVADFGMSKLTSLNPRFTPLTACPGTPAYMSPEALLDPPIYTEKLDCFQAGVLMVQIITRKFPEPGEAMNRVRDERYPTGWILSPVPEITRRDNHLRLVTTTHPMFSLAVDCLKDTDTERPSAQQICDCLSALKETPQYRQSLEAGEGGERDGDIQERDQLIQQLRHENEEREGEVKSLRDELQQKEEERQRLSRRLDLANAQIHQTLERQRQVEDQLQGEIYELRESVSSKTRLLQEKELEKDQLQREKEGLLREKEEEKDQFLNELHALILQLQQFQQFDSYTCNVSGPGLQSATANHPTHVIVEVIETSGRPCTLQQNVTAELELISKATSTSPSGSQPIVCDVVATTSPPQEATSKRWWPWSKRTPVAGGEGSLASKATPTSPSSKFPVIHVAGATTSPSRYEVSYTAVSRGQHKLHVRLNYKEINGSPFTITVYPDPTQLGRPVRVVTRVNSPYGIAFNSRGEMIISDCLGHQISIFDVRGQRIRTFGSMKYPRGIAIDDADNIYVCSDHKLQKFTSSGELIKCVGQKGSKEGEFNVPRGITLYNNQMYMCDGENHRIQVFDLDLNFIRSIGSYSKGRGELYSPDDIKFDSTGNMYIADCRNNTVQVLDSSGHFIRLFGQEGEGRLRGPSSVLIADQYVYVSDIMQHHIVVYTSSGQFVTSFGRWGPKEGQLSSPFSITSCIDGYIYVSDHGNKRVQVF